jgi:hypothetical protein
MADRSVDGTTVMAWLIKFSAALVGGTLLLGLLPDPTSEIPPENESLVLARATAGVLLHTLLVKGEAHEAYDQLCAATRERFTVDGFRAAVGGSGPLREYRFDKSFSLNEETGVARLRVYLHFYRGGDRMTRDMEVHRESDGEWRVCGNPL